MITEDLLRESLAVEAEHYDLPPNGPQAILAAAAPTGARRRRLRLPKVRLQPLGAFAIAMVALVGVSVVASKSNLGGSDDKPSATGVAGTGAQLEPHSGGTLSSGGADSLLDLGGSRPAPTAAPAPAAGVAVPPRANSTSGQAKDTAATRVIRTGQVQLEVGKGKTAAVVAELTRITSAYRGFVASSKAATYADEPSATVVLRVPSASWDGLLGQATKLGKPLSQTTQGDDVTDQYTDLQARLRALTASRAQFQTLLTRANTIGDVLAVQQQITQVQTQIEQLQGQLNSLENRSAFATLEVSITEPGNPVTSLGDPERKGFAKAWAAAKDNFTGGVEWLVSASGTIAFLLLLALLVFVVGRVTRRLYHRHFV